MQSKPVPSLFQQHLPCAVSRTQSAVSSGLEQLADETAKTLRTHTTPHNDLIFESGSRNIARNGSGSSKAGLWQRLMRVIELFGNQLAMKCASSEPSSWLPKSNSLADRSSMKG